MKNYSGTKMWNVNYVALIMKMCSMIDCVHWKNAAMYIMWKLFLYVWVWTHNLSTSILVSWASLSLVHQSHHSLLLLITLVNSNFIQMHPCRLLKGKMFLIRKGDLLPNPVIVWWKSVNIKFIYIALWHVESSCCYALKIGWSGLFPKMKALTLLAPLC